MDYRSKSLLESQHSLLFAGLSRLKVYSTRHQHDAAVRLGVFSGSCREYVRLRLHPTPESITMMLQILEALESGTLPPRTPPQTPTQNALQETSSSLPAAPATDLQAPGCELSHLSLHGFGLRMLRAVKAAIRQWRADRPTQNRRLPEALPATGLADPQYPATSSPDDITR